MLASVGAVHYNILYMTTLHKTREKDARVPWIHLAPPVHVFTVRYQTSNTGTAPLPAFSHKQQVFGKDKMQSKRVRIRK